MEMEPSKSPMLRLESRAKLLMAQVEQIFGAFGGSFTTLDKTAE
jgi:hypothetical protein